MTAVVRYDQGEYYTICNDGIITCKFKDTLLNHLKNKNYSIIIIEDYFIERIGRVNKNL